MEGARPFLQAPAGYDSDGAAKYLTVPGLRAHIEALRDAVAALGGFDEALLEGTLRGVAEARGIKAGALIHATRLAMTGKTVSPGLFETLRLLGPASVVARFDALIATL